MNRYQIGSSGICDFYLHPGSLKGVMVGDDMIIKELSVSTAGEVTAPEYIEVPKEFYCVDGSEKNDRVVFAGDENQAHVSSFSDLNNNSSFCDYLGKIWDIALDKNGVRACIVGDDKNPVIFNFETNKRLSFDSSVPCSLLSCKWSPDSKTFAVVAKNGQLSLYLVDDDFTQIKQLHTWKVTERDLKEDCPHGFNPHFVTEDKLIVAGKDCLQIITRKDGVWHYSISSKIKHQGIIYQLALLRDNFIVTVGQDKKAFIWNLSLELKIKAFDISYKILRIRFVPANDLLAILDDQGQVFTVTDCISGGSAASLPAREDTRISEEASVADEVGDAMVIKTEVGASLATNRMDEEKRPQPTEDEESNYRPEEPVGFDSFVGHNNKNLVYDEAEEADMRRKAGILEDLESRYGRSNQKAAKPRREDNAPQPAFIPGSTTGTGEVRSKRQFLCHNMFGKVISRAVGEKTILDAEYSLSSLSKQGILNDANYNLAAINYRGVLLASTGQVIQEDEYIDEEKTDRQKNSILLFASSDRKKNWEINFGDKENIFSIAMGLHCMAVYTNKKIIRIIAPDGNEDQMFGFNKPVVGMSLYENLLAIVYHDCAPFSGCQMLRVQIMNLSNREVVDDRDIVLSQDSKLRWFGFSEEGIFYVQDTKFMIWGQQNQHLWAPVYDGAKEANMWMLGIDGQTIVYLKLPYGELEPSIFIDYPISNTTFRPPYIKDEGRARFLELLKYDQGRLRHAHFGHMKNSLFTGEDPNPNDPMTVNRSTLKSEDDVERLSIEADKVNIERARLALLHGDDEAAIFYGLQMESPKTMDILLRLIESLGYGRIAERLRYESEKLGNVQFKLKQGPTRKYVPQLVLQATTAHEVRFAHQIDLGHSRTTDASLLAFNSMKMNKSSFADIVDENRPAHNGGGKVKASESSKEEEKPKKKATTSHDLFRDLSEMAKTKR